MKKQKIKIDKVIPLGQEFDLRISGIVPAYRKGRGILFYLGNFLVNFVDEECTDLATTLSGPFEIIMGEDPENTQLTFTLSRANSTSAKEWMRAARDASDTIQMIDNMIEQYDVFRRETAADGSWLDQLLKQIGQKDLTSAFAVMHAHKLKTLAQHESMTKATDAN